MVVDLGQVDWVEDAASNKTWFAYDAESGRQIDVPNSLGDAIYSHFDAEGRLLATLGRHLSRGLRF